MLNGENSREQVALFVDLENFVGFCTGFGLKIDLSQNIRKLTEHGRVVIRKSYGDIYKLPLEKNGKEDVRAMLQNNLIQHEDVRYRHKYKNSSDIKLIIEALSIAYTNPTITTFAIVADDRDYIPLFSKLREIGKTVVGIGGSKESTDEYFRGACDSFYYHDSITGANKAIDPVELQEFKEAFSNISKAEEDEIIALLIEATKAVEATGKLPLGSMVAKMMRALKSDLDFEDYGFSGLKGVGEVAKQRGFVEIEPYGGDIQFICNDAAINDYFEYQDLPQTQEFESEHLSLIDQYRCFVETKLKANLPNCTEREQIYSTVQQSLEELTSGISLHNLSKEVANNANHADVDQSSIYKILYGLFRSRAFICSDSFNKYDPIIVDLAIDRKEMDNSFVSNLMSVFRREGRGIHFDSHAWSLYLYGDENHCFNIQEIFDQGN
jgi:uncharacterized LabA/DUF88 family protein